MDTSPLQTTLWVILIVATLLMAIGFVSACFASNEKIRNNGLSLGMIMLLISLVVAVWGGFNNYMAFEPERNAVISKIIDCKSVAVHTDTNGLTNYMVTIDGKEYPVEIKVLSSSE